VEIDEIKNKIDQMVISQTTTDAKVTANENGITKLNSIGGQLLWHRFVNPAAYPPGTSDADNLSQSDIVNGKFIRFGLSGAPNTALNLALFCFYNYTAGSVTLYAKKPTAGMIRATFTYMVFDPTFRGDRRYASWI
jgi:hypothetical protein